MRMTIRSHQDRIMPSSKHTATGEVMSSVDGVGIESDMMQIHKCLGTISPAFP